MLCAEFSRLAYCSSDRIRAELSRIGFELRGFFNEKDSKADTQAFLASNATLAVLAFRGTQPDSIQDLLTDAKVKLPPWQGPGRVHAGFAYALGIVWTEIAKEFQSCKCRLLFTGHSLGAALATLAAAMHRPQAVFTFGSPRVGDPNFAAALAGLQISRYVDCADLICRLPFSWYLQFFPPAILKYIHVGRVHYADQRGQVSVDPAEQMIKSDQREARLQFLKQYAGRPGNVLIRDLADHAPLNYVSAVSGRS